MRNVDWDRWPAWLNTVIGEALACVVIVWWLAH